MIDDILKRTLIYLQLIAAVAAPDPRYSMPDGPEAGNDGYKLDGGDEEEEVSKETEDYDASEDCDEVCPECMSRRVSILDLITWNFTCLNCGHEWFRADLKDKEEEE